MTANRLPAVDVGFSNSVAPRDVGIMMIGINLPMTVYFIYDVVGTIKQDIAVRLGSNKQKAEE